MLVGLNSCLVVSAAPSVSFLDTWDQKQIILHQFNKLSRGYQFAHELNLKNDWIQKHFMGWNLCTYLIKWYFFMSKMFLIYLRHFNHFYHDNPDGWEWVKWLVQALLCVAAKSRSCFSLFISLSIMFVQVTCPQCNMNEFDWPWDSSLSLRSAWTVCWQWTQSCWSSRMEIWAQSSRMHHWPRRTL